MKLPAATFCTLLPLCTVLPLAGLLSCSRSLPMPAEPSPHPLVSLTEAAAGQTVALRAGQQLRITLPETPTTGYRWTVPELCTDHLELQSDTASHPDSQMPGAPGSRTWVLQAKAPGTCEVKLQAARSWEKSASGRSVSFPVKIEP